MAGATAIVPSVSSVVSPIRHSRLALPTYRGMGVPAGPSNPRTSSGYHLSTPSRDSVSVCLPIASPVAIPLRQARIRCFTGRSGPKQLRSRTASCSERVGGFFDCPPRAGDVLQRRDTDAARPPIPAFHHFGVRSALGVNLLGL